ncbi:MAG: glycosyltransferase family 2 protein [Planctomycetota bacterium]
MPISILVLTLNEEANLPGCLESVRWSDDVVVVDSGSTDATARVAADFGARVLEHPFESFAEQQNWALDHADFRHGWVFYLDADERMTPELRAELEAIAADPNEDRVAFYAGRKNMFRGRWLRRSMPPGSIMRFFRTEGVRFVQRGHGPEPRIEGGHGYCRSLFIHHNFSKGVGEWFRRHERYAREEAAQAFAELEEGTAGVGGLFSSDRVVRRRALKNLSWRLPLRPVIKFLYMYVLKLGLLDGRAGLDYCVMQAMYEQMIVLNVRELKRAARGLPPA